MLNWKLENNFDFNGRTIKWDTKGDGAPIVVVHGTPWSSLNLQHLINGLADQYKVFYFDLLGYGQSDKSDGDVSLGIQNEVLTKLIQYWQLDKPIVIGHDFGGTTVLRTHLLNKVEYKKLIVIDPVAISPWGSPFFNHVNKHEAAFSGMPDYIHEAVVETYIKTAAFKALDQTTIEGILEPWKGAYGKPAFYRQIAQADARFTDEIQDKYSSICTPTLILWGEEDTWIPLDKGKKLHKLIPKSEMQIIPNSGHLVIEEEPLKLVEKIKKFIGKS
ncbi:alpha/beta fold hydrolase [Chondrinema litorale]|uniref:alpha/beta fold hydrolase n=1 Tax=Chondrinema litorale TaxID=2994555 RepID=UPI00254367E3|nr:alpha/beta hydrolase [Chondrinema litorale]UZR97509.1 alpha/beta hydrolase [Chondrinema litorale]